MANKYALERSECITELITPMAFFRKLIEKIEKEKQLIQKAVSSEDGFIKNLESLETEKMTLISSADMEEKLYQKYITDLAEWEEKKPKSLVIKI